MENLYIISVLVLVGYAVLYFSGRKYLEGFENRFIESPVTDASTIMNKNKTREKEYPMQPKMDMYDVSAVYNNQGSKPASKKQLNDAMTRYPLDWSVQGAGSQVFQEGQARYEKQMKSTPSQVKPFEEQPTDMLLPDASTLEEEERKILQTYKPESSKGLLHYSMHDVTQLLDKLYAKKGLVPVIAKSTQGDNVWEIVEVKEKNPQIVWEDDTREKMTNRGEDTIHVPYTASDIAAGLDPFKHPRNRVRTGGYDIKENSELDRMFQPTYPVPQWQ
jgi:hypothetical protein